MRIIMLKDFQAYKAGQNVKLPDDIAKQFIVTGKAREFQKGTVSARAPEIAAPQAPALANQPMAATTPAGSSAQPATVSGQPVKAPARPAARTPAPLKKTEGEHFDRLPGK